jgi:tRNA U34 5-carboxymethylaminomethyl modifying GTPase MnmE/TrmE
MAMLEQETIVAISTPVGRGGIGVVRIPLRLSDH